MYARELALDTPYLNAAGALGFAPPPKGALSVQLGAFVTNPISALPRKPAATRAAVAHPGGFLLHSGLPNPGLRAALRRYADAWARADLPVWVHIIPADAQEAADMVRRLEDVEGVQGVEVGLPPDADEDEAAALVSGAVGELPLAVSLPLDRCHGGWIKRLAALEIGAVTLSAPRGMTVDALGQAIAGRLYGPALFPQAFAALKALRAAVPHVIVGAGVYRLAHAQTLLDAGAHAVQFDAAFWKAGGLD